MRLRRRIGRPSRLSRLVALLGNPRFHGKFCRVGYGDSCRRVSRSVGREGVLRMERDRLVEVVREPALGRIFDGRDGAPPIESSLNSATRLFARRLFFS